MPEPTAADTDFMARMSEAEQTDRPVPLAIQQWQLTEDLSNFEMYTSKGIILGFRHGPDDARKCLVLVGGAMGGLGGPAGIYHDVGLILAQLGIATVRLHFRNPGDVVESAIDTLLVTRLQIEQGVERVALGGHSFGSAVVVQAARTLEDRELAGLVFLAPQTAGTQGLEEIGAIPALFVHGANDGVLDPDCSRELAASVDGDPDVRILDGVGHLMVEAADDVRDLITDFAARIFEDPVLA